MLTGAQIKHKYYAAKIVNYRSMQVRDKVDRKKKIWVDKVPRERTIWPDHVQQEHRYINKYEAFGKCEFGHLIFTEYCDAGGKSLCLARDVVRAILNRVLCFESDFPTCYNSLASPSIYDDSSTFANYR